jgi:hypothetical protein
MHEHLTLSAMRGEETVARDMRRGLLSLDGNFPTPPPAELIKEFEYMNRLPFSIGQSLSEKVAGHYIDRYRAEQLADDEDFLAPMIADPSHETREHFIQRAADHYDARALRVKRAESVGNFIAVPARQSPELYQHVEWLLRFQVQKESYAVIAKSSGLRGPDQAKTVGKAVRELAGLIDLSLRPVSRGRPRSNGNSTH